MSYSNEPASPADYLPPPNPSPMTPFAGEVWTMTAELSDGTTRNRAVVTMLVVVEELPENELTPEAMTAQDAAARKAVLDKLRPFLNNRTYVDLDRREWAIPLDSVPVVKRAGT